MASPDPLQHLSAVIDWLADAATDDPADDAGQALLEVLERLRDDANLSLPMDRAIASSLERIRASRNRRKPRP